MSCLGICYQYSTVHFTHQNKLWRHCKIWFAADATKKWQNLSGSIYSGAPSLCEATMLPKFCMFSPSGNLKTYISMSHVKYAVRLVWRSHSIRTGEAPHNSNMFGEIGKSKHRSWKRADKWNQTNLVNFEAAWFFLFFFSVAVAIQSWKAIESLIVTFVTTRTGETFILSAGLPHILPGFTFFGLNFILKKIENAAAVAKRLVM